MSHPSLRPLLMLLEQSERQRDDALAHFNAAQAMVDAAQRQSEQLTSYRDDTQNRWRDRMSGGVSMALMQCYHGFVDRLHGAVDQQSSRIEQLKAEAMRRQSAWQSAEVKVASVQKLIERRELLLRKGQERQERRMEDEHASRMVSQRVEHDDHEALL